MKHDTISIIRYLKTIIEENYLEENIKAKDFQNNLYHFQNLLFTPKGLAILKNLCKELGLSSPEAFSRCLCFFYCIELYSLNSGGVSAEKFSQGMMLFNLLKNPSLEISESYPINELDEYMPSELKALYTKYGYYFDNIIE